MIHLCTEVAFICLYCYNIMLLTFTDSDDVSGAQNVPSQNVPSLPLLMDEVGNNTNKWKGIAVALDIPITYIERIYMDNNNVEEYFQSVFSQWEMQCTRPYTWDTLVKVLESPSVGESRLAGEIRRKYCS